MSTESLSSSSKPSLLRALGPFTAMTVVVGNVIGSGIFAKPGTIAASGSSFSLIIGIWVLGGALCILGALCIAELATMLPRAGGLYLYLREAYGPFVAFLFGWTELLFSRPGSIGALAIFFYGSLRLPPSLGSSMLFQVLVTTSLILGMAWINIIGVTWGGRVQVVTTVIKVVSVTLIILSPILLAPFVGWEFDAANYSTAVAEPEQKSLLPRLGVVLLAVMWAYNGWHGITPLAEEVRSPQRNVPLALFGGIGLLIVLYVSANLTYHGILSMQQLAGAKENGAREAMHKLAGSAGVSAIALIILCSTFGAINTNLLQAPRVTFAMGRDGTFFRGLGRVHANYRTPVVAILVTCFMAIGLIVAAAVAKTLAKDVQADAISWELGQKIIQSLHKDSIFELLTNFVIFSASIFYLLAVMGVIILRMRRPELERPYRAWGYPVTPVLFIATYVCFLTLVYLDKPLESRAGLVLIALGIPVYFVYRRWSRRADSTE